MTDQAVMTDSEMDRVLNRFRGESFEFEGYFYYSCSCWTPCPCMFGSDASVDNCQFPLVFEVERGHVGDRDVGGLKMILLNYWGGKDLIGNLKNGRAKAAIYVDSAASPELQESMLSVMLTIRREKYGVIKGPFAVPIDVARGEDEATVTVANVLDLTIQRIKNNGEHVTITHVPYHVTRTVHPGYASEHRFSDPELGEEWDWEGRNSDFGTFSLEGTVGEKRESWF